MIVWNWVRGLRWWWQTLIGVIGVPLVLALLYVGGRSLQYLVAEGDAGLYTPASVHVLARARGLKAHLDRIEGTFAWSTIERKLLRDPAIRPRINAELRGAGLPTLDDLQDPRKGGQLSRSNLSRFAGRDLVVGVAARDSWKTARFCASTRLRWLEYLATPFAPLVLKRDGNLLRAGQVWIGFAGAVAIAGNDKVLVGEALRGKGKAPEGSRPVEVEVRFDGSRPLSELRASIADLGLLPHVKLKTSKTLRISADLDGTAARIDAVLEGVENSYPGQAPPNEMLDRAPAWTTGVFTSTASFRDVYAWAGGQGKFVRELVDQLERGRMSETLLPLVDAGVAVMTGTAENKGKLFPAFALLVRTSEPKRAVDALTQVVRKIGGNFVESKVKSEQVGDVEVFFMDPPDGGMVDDFLTASWAAVEGGLVFGNNLIFTKSVIASDGELWRDRRIAKRLGGKLKELGFSGRPGLAGGVLVPPLFFQSFDGVVDYVSRMMALQKGDVAFRAELDREWAEQGRSGLSEPEKLALFAEAREAKIKEYEAELRRSLRGLDPVRWCAFESAEVPGGVSLRLAIGFDSLTDR